MLPGRSPMDARAGDRIVEEQAALRRVAVLAARGASPEEVFIAVTAEVRTGPGCRRDGSGPVDPDGAMTYVARWSGVGEDPVAARARASAGGT